MPSGLKKGRVAALIKLNDFIALLGWFHLGSDLFPHICVDVLDTCVAPDTGRRLGDRREKLSGTLEDQAKRADRAA